MTPPRLLTLAEVTDRLHVSRRTVATLVATRQLPTVIIGTRSTRVRVIDLEEYIEGQIRKAEPDLMTARHVCTSTPDVRPTSVTVRPAASSRWSTSWPSRSCGVMGSVSPKS